ncbi:MAG: hypothetical protein LKJ25_08700 [Clostridia bacterium]|nr:hypothetical protein [Clostridia bacterium]
MIREKKIHCGKYGQKSKYIEVDLYPYPNKIGVSLKGKRIKINETEPKQKNLNDKRSRRYFNQITKCNFHQNDYHVSFTYKNKYLPATVEEAEREAMNYIRRLKHKMRKLGLELKYLLITEKGDKNGRVHHHLIINSGLSRDEIEDLWSRPRRKGEKKRESLGYVNCDRLQFNGKGIEELSSYLTKNPQGRRRWRGSHNLIKPWFYTPNDYKYSRRQIDKMAVLPPDCNDVKNYWERKYKGYQLDECVPVFNDSIGRWSIYLKLSLKE